MCEVMMPDGVTPHAPTSAPPSSTIPAPGSASSRSTSSTRTAARSASLTPAIRRPQGTYYTGVGYKNVGDVARKIVEEHLDLCLAAGINHEGINAEVAKGQWEFQIFGKGSKQCRRRDVDGPLPAGAPDREVRHRHRVSLQAARPATDWNGSGMHANFSTDLSARDGRQGLLRGADGGLREVHRASTSPSTARTTTCASPATTRPRRSNKFSYGVADRGASIRVPHSFVKNDYKGYLEDRRPNSQGDPYQIASQILKTIATVPLETAAAKAA